MAKKGKKNIKQGSIHLVDSATIGTATLKTVCGKVAASVVVWARKTAPAADNKTICKTCRPDPAKAKKETAKKKGNGKQILGTATGLTRAGWFRKALIDNRVKQLSDSAINAAAVKEFGKENIPGKTALWQIGKMRTVFNGYQKRGEYRLDKNDPPFEKYGD